MNPSRLFGLTPLLVALHVTIANAQTIDLTGLWQDDSGGGGVYRVRHVGNQLFWIVDGTSKGSYVNIAFGEITGHTMTGKWVDLPGSPTLGGGDISLRIESNDRFVKISSSTPYGAQAWTRQGSTDGVVPGGVPPANGSLVGTWALACCNEEHRWKLYVKQQQGNAFSGAFSDNVGGGDVTNGQLRGNAIEFDRSGAWGRQHWSGQLVNDRGSLRMTGTWTGDYLDRYPGRNNWHAEKQFEIGAQFQRNIGEQQGENTPDIAGTWTYGTEWVYIITQNGPNFTWSLARISQKAEGTITGKSVSAKWSGPTASGSATGTIIVDASGKATRIEWSNGVVFTRN